MSGPGRAYVRLSALEADVGFGGLLPGGFARSATMESLGRARPLPHQATAIESGGTVKLLLTSGGVTNTSIREALVDLLGKPIADSDALCIPTAAYARQPIAADPNVPVGRSSFGTHTHLLAAGGQCDGAWLACTTRSACICAGSWLLVLRCQIRQGLGDYLVAVLRGVLVPQGGAGGGVSEAGHQFG